MPYSVAEANRLFDQLPEFAAARLREISSMAQPYIEITDRYARLAARLTNLLGHTPPQSTQDRVIRDLFADASDFLYESRILIVSGKLNVAYSLARRAYESLSLLHLCSIDQAFADKWEGGKKIGNCEVRKKLGSHPLGESEESMKALYTFYSLAAHPNRDLVAFRYLGEGNEFVLGMIGAPQLLLIADYSAKHLDLWHWIAATTSHFYRHVIQKADTDYFAEYMASHDQAKLTKQWLSENVARLHGEALAMESSAR